MQLRWIIIPLVLFVIAGTFVSVSVETDSSISDKTLKTSIATSHVDPTEIVNENNLFAIDFYSQEPSKSDGNIFFSPWSITTVFAIAFEGAKGGTADEIQDIFGFPSDYTSRTSQFQSAINDLNPHDSRHKLSIANTLWLAQSFEPFVEYVDTATNFYDSEVSTINFSTNDGVDKINA